MPQCLAALRHAPRFIAPRLRVMRLLGALALGLFVAAPAIAAPPDQPFLRIETGMHGGTINRLAIVPEAGQIITASDDKTARVWSLEDGSAEGVMRGWIGEADEGALYAVAAHDRIVAAAGRTGIAWDSSSSIYLFSRARGSMIGAIGGLPTAVTSLAFSPDGQLLAVGLQGRAGVRVFEYRKGREAMTDNAYGDSVTWVAFGPDGQLAVAAADGKVRTYQQQAGRDGPEFSPSAIQSLPQGHKPWGIAFSPKGDFVAVGAADAAMVHVLEADGLKAVQSLAGAAGASGALPVVAWTPDGAGLIAAGTYRDAEGRNAIRRWANNQPRDFAVGTDAVSDLRVLPDGRMVFATAEPSFGVLDAEGRLVFARERQFADFRDAMDGTFRLSADGMTIDFGLSQGGREPMRFSLANRRYAEAPANPRDTLAPVDNGGGQRVTDWRNGAQPKLNGRVLALEPSELARSTAVGSKGGVALGTDYFLRFYAGEREAWKVPLPGPAWAVSQSSDGRFVVAAVGDGTLRWFRTDSGAPVVSLFAHPDGQRWLVWTPEGFFDHSRPPAGEDGSTLVGYHLNLAKPLYTEFVNIEQMYQRFYRRDLVTAKLRGEDDRVQQQSEAAGKVADIVSQGLPPRVELVGYCARGTCTDIDASGRRSTTPVRVPDDKLTLKLKVTDRGGGIGDVIVRRDGAAVATDTRVVGTEKEARIEEREVPLAEGENQILISAVADNEVEAAEPDRALFRVVYEAPAAVKAADPSLRTLYVISVGIADYQHINDLDNPDNDARGLVNILAERADKAAAAGRSPVYDRIEAATLIDGEATKERITAAFREMSARIRPRDLFILFLAGHGIPINGRYHFAVWEADATDEATLARTALNQDELADLLRLVQANQGMILLDTCYSGALLGRPDEQKEQQETFAATWSKDSGRIILAGTNHEQEAYDAAGELPEQPAFPDHGLFTGWLLTGIAGEAAGPRAKEISAGEIALYTQRVIEDVTTGTAYEQTPTYVTSGNNALFPLVPVLPR